MRIAHALAEGLRERQRFASMADDLDAVRSALAGLPEAIRMPIVAAVTAKLAQEFAARNSFGLLLHDDEGRSLQAQEVAAADAVMRWLVAEAANAGPAETHRLLAAVERIAAARDEAREVAEAMVEAPQARH